MTQLRDSLAADVTVGWDYAFLLGEPCDKHIADAILRSPEMYTIREALKRAARPLTEFPNRLTEAEALRRMGLAPAVIEWVLS